MALTDGLIGAWVPWIGSTGPRLIDHSAYHRDGTLTNMDPATDWPGSSFRGQAGRVLDFDGTNDYVATSTSMNGLAVAGISLWYWRSSSAHNFFCGGGLGGQQGPRANIFLLGTNLYMTAETNTSGAAFTLSSSVNNTGWMHLFYRFNGAAASRLQPYLNGVPLSFSASGTLANVLGSVGSLEIGRSSGENQFGTGRVAETLLFNRDLSPAEISRLHQIGPGGIFQAKRRVYSSAIAAATNRRRRILCGDYN